MSDKDELNIFFRIYDENMREKGIGIVQISQSAVAKVLETVQLYHNGGWAVLDKNDQLLASEGAQELVKKLHVFVFSLLFSPGSQCGGIIVLINTFIPIIKQINSSNKRKLTFHHIPL